MNTPQPSIEWTPQTVSQTQAGRIQEEIWVLQVQQGNAEAFASLMERYDRGLLYYLRRFTASPDQALDVAQDVWVCAFRGIKKLRTPGLFRAWLYQIAHARIVSQIRKNVRQEQVRQSFSAEQESDQSYAEPLSIDPEVVHHALAALSPDHREVLVLRFLEDLSLEEIAHALQCSVGTIKSRLHYAKQALKKEIESDYEQH